ncbi:UPF0178 protein [Actinomycetota bacterium]|nr:UPF0178 protein [Actinomycetota bacterium]
MNSGEELISTLPIIFIDADACPVTAETLNLARKNKLPVVVVDNTTQNIGRHIKRSDPRKLTDGFWVDTISVDVGADSADFAIIEELNVGDIVVTQDIGLAAMVLGRDAYVIGVRGREYLSETIDFDMHIRHEEKKVRRHGGRTKGPAPFTDEDREHFIYSLQNVIDKAKLVQVPSNEPIKQGILESKGNIEFIGDGKIAIEEFLG